MSRIMARCLTILGGLLTAALSAVWCSADEIQLKNGLVLQGKVVRLTTFGSGKAAAADSESIQSYHIVMVENDWQRYFVPLRQVAATNKNVIPRAEERFRIEQKRTAQHGPVGAVGGQFQQEPFNEFGQRLIKFPGGARPLVVTQGITEISPSRVTITALTHNWTYGVATSTLPPQEIEAILRQRLKPGAEDRLALARFFAQAEMYPQAFAELDAIGREFPELGTQVGQAREFLLQNFGRAVLAELKRRYVSGQHELAESQARKLDRQQVGGEVRAEVEEFLERYASRHDSLEKARLLLGDLHGRIDEPELLERLQAMRSTVNDELSLETLSRLDPFVRAEKDPQLTAREKLALGYSGWVLGPAHAMTDLNQAVRLWDARHLVLEYLRAVHPHDHERLLDEIRKLEGVGVAAVQQLIGLLPPWLEPPPPEENGQSLVELSPANEKDRGIRYRVLLPPEYSRDHRYPLLIVLRPEGRTLSQTLQWWGGTPGMPGPAQRRGFIVIAPDYAADDQREYAYDIPAHRVVLECLRDARRRYSVDSERVFLAGHLMGGDAAFDIGFAHPDEFAGVIPFCGRCGEYGKHLWENGQYTGWYVVSGELERQPEQQKDHDTILNRCYLQGVRFDMVTVEFIGRGRELFADELPRIFDWMENRRRAAAPKDFTIKTLRQTDNEYFGYRADALPRTVILPLPRGVRFPGSMTLEVTMTPGNTIHIKSPSKQNTLWLNESLIDLDQPVTIPDAKPARRGLQAPDLAVLLEDFRLRADRARLYSIKIEF